jgi:biopolymer transport protein TolR
MLTRGKNVQLPVAVAAEAESEVRDPVVLTLTEDKRLWLDNRDLPEAKLLVELKRVLLTDRGRELLIKADSSVSVRELRPLLQKIKAAGVRRISFAVLGASGAAP